MEIIQVKQENQERLFKYSSKYGPEHDSSFLPGRDFSVTHEHPSYLLVDAGQTIGAVSLMRTPRFLGAGKGRFSILHSNRGRESDYARLLGAIRPHFQGLREVFLFLPEHQDQTAKILAGLGFQVERFSFVLQRSGPALPEPVFPEGVYVQPLSSGDRDGIRRFSACLNQEFKGLAGHTPSSPEDIASWFADQSYLENGLCLLIKGGEAIGTIAMMKDVDDQGAGEILAFGILPGQQGKGLGRSLFRYGFNFLLKWGLTPVFLAVNGENHTALKLYRSEGFHLIESVVCHSFQISRG